MSSSRKRCQIACKNSQFRLFLFAILPLLQLVLLLLQAPSPADCSPIRHFHQHQQHQRPIRQSQPQLQHQPLLGHRGMASIDAIAANRIDEPPVSPPHCSRATVTLAQSSRLTKRASFSPSAHPNSSARGGAGHSTQLSLNIGIGQTVCFTMTGSPEEEEKSNESKETQQSGSEETEPSNKSNSSFIVALARRQRRPPLGTISHRKSRAKGVVDQPRKEEVISPDRVLHSVTVLDLEQYHAITERYRFGIPELETRCICECESGTANCAAERYKYGQCSGDADSEQQTTAANSDFESNSGENAAAGLNWASSSSSRKQSPDEQSPAVCHRTFFANQPTGRHCSKRIREQSSSSARLCCQLRFRAYRQRTFTALRLESAVSSVLLQYSQWAWRSSSAAGNNINESGGVEKNNGTSEREGVQHEEVQGVQGGGEGDVPQQRHWVELERRKVRVQLDGAMHNTVLSEEAGLKLSVLGLSGAKSAGAQLDPAVYFAENNAADGTLGELIGQMPVNRITEHDFHKLGWLRLDERGHPFVQSGEVFLEKIHHARVDDCAEQRFRSVLDASYYVNADNNASTQFKLAEPLSSVHKWIRSARVLDSHQRIALVRAREGLSLEVTLTASQRTPEADNDHEEQPQQQRRLITFVHNSSRLADFTPLLVIDRFSNSMLNLTLFNASGVLNGYVRSLDDPEGNEIDGFSVNVPSAENNQQQDVSSTVSNAPGQTWARPVSVQVRIKPYPLGSLHVICLRPDDADLAQELCRPVQSVYHELEVNTVRNEWAQAVGECKQCNQQISVEGFAKYLNPANWTKGIGSLSDALMLISDLIGYFVVILIVYALLSKVVFPVLGCCCVSCAPAGLSGLFCSKRSKK